jgi:hypothetical protein
LLQRSTGLAQFMLELLNRAITLTNFLKQFGIRLRLLFSELLPLAIEGLFFLLSVEQLFAERCHTLLQFTARLFEIRGGLHPFTGGRDSNLDVAQADANGVSVRQLQMCGTATVDQDVLRRRQFAQGDASRVPGEEAQDGCVLRSRNTQIAPRQTADQEIDLVQRVLYGAAGSLADFQLNVRQKGGPVGRDRRMG